MEARHSEIRDAWVALLSIPEWSHFATFTFKYPATTDYLHEQMRKYFRRVERLGNAIWWVYVAERTQLGQLHVHALIGGTENRSLNALERRWRMGISDVEQYDSERNGLRYITDDVATDHAEIFFSDNLPTIVLRNLDRD